MPFVAYIHAEEPRDRRVLNPNWRLWRWLAAAVVVAFASAHADGAVGALLMFAVFVLACRALGEALGSSGDGLREWRQ